MLFFFQGRDGYGQKKPNCHIANGDIEKLDISIFNEDDLKEHQAKVLVILGKYAGFRGSKEPTYLKKDQFTFGTFARDSPIFPSKKYIAIRYMDEDKTNKLNLSTNHLREIENCRLPILSDGTKGDLKNDAGGAISRLRTKVPNTTSDRVFLRISKGGAQFIKQPIGANTVRSRYAFAFKKWAFLIGRPSNHML